MREDRAAAIFFDTLDGGLARADERQTFSYASYLLAANGRAAFPMPDRCTGSIQPTPITKSRVASRLAPARSKAKHGAANSNRLG